MHNFYCFFRVAYVMDLRGWEYLWKTFANLFLFVIIVFVFAILIWILIAIEPYTHLDLNCYRICILFGNSDRAQTYPPTSALILTLQL